MLTESPQRRTAAEDDRIGSEKQESKNFLHGEHLIYVGASLRGHPGVARKGGAHGGTPLQFETLTKRVYHGNPNNKFSSKVSVEKQPCVLFL